MVAVRVYVEGGGDARSLQAPLREAVRRFLDAALPGARRPTVVACGGRGDAFGDFKKALRSHPSAFNLLLVDSESPVHPEGPWRHVAERPDDRWSPPPGVDDTQLHFMALTMEAWLCADPEALAAYFGPGFRADRLPRRADLETEPNADLLAKLHAATEGSRLGRYRKGRDLELLGRVSPAAVQARCAHARRLVETLRERLG